MSSVIQQRALKLFATYAQKMDSERVRSVANEGLQGLEPLAASGWRWVRQLWQRGQLLVWLLRDASRGRYQLPWRALAGIAAAVGYFVIPTDALPDGLLLAGFADDALVMSVAFRWLRHEIDDYLGQLPAEHAARFDLVDVAT